MKNILWLNKRGLNFNVSNMVITQQVSKRLKIQKVCCILFSIFLAYLRLDVYQLADVFESFRQLALQQDGLDPVNYVGLPGFTWDSAFKFTGVEIHLLQDEDMYTFFEAGTRGGKKRTNTMHFIKII